MQLRRQDRDGGLDIASGVMRLSRRLTLFHTVETQRSVQAARFPSGEDGVGVDDAGAGHRVCLPRSAKLSRQQPAVVTFNVVAREVTIGEQRADRFGQLREGRRRRDHRIADAVNGLGVGGHRPFRIDERGPCGHAAVREDGGGGYLHNAVLPRPDAGGFQVNAHQWAGQGEAGGQLPRERFEIH